MDEFSGGGLKFRKPVRVEPRQATAVVPQPVATPEPPAEPARTVPAKSKKPKWPLFVGGGLLMLIIFAAATAFFLKSFSNNLAKRSDSIAASSVKIAGISFPVYYPNNLPPGFIYNKDDKVLTGNVLYYSITGPDGTTYHVTLQPIPTAFNFSSFKDKFLKPDQFATNVGSVLVGQVGANLIGSIQTNNSVWIIINSNAKGNLSAMESITRSFELAK